MVNPVLPMAAAFFKIWNELPIPIRSLFYVSLILAFVYTMYKIFSS